MVGPASGVRVWCLGFRGLRFGVEGLGGLRALGLGPRDLSFRTRVLGLRGKRSSTRLGRLKMYDELEVQEGAGELEVDPEKGFWV